MHGQIAVLSYESTISCISPLLSASFKSCYSFSRMNNGLQKHWILYWRYGKIFFQFLAEWQWLLDHTIDRVRSSTRAKKLKDTFKTRWTLTLFLGASSCHSHNTAGNGLSSQLWQFWQTMRLEWRNCDASYWIIHQLEFTTFLICFQILLECLTHLRCLTIKLKMQAIWMFSTHTNNSVVCILW